MLPKATHSKKNVPHANYINVTQTLCKEELLHPQKINVFSLFFSYASLSSLMSVNVAESRCILLPVVLRVLQAHMQEQRDLVMCARILTSMLSLIKKEENGTAVSIEGINSCHLLAICPLS